MSLLRKLELIFGIAASLLGLAALAFSLAAPLGTASNSCSTTLAPGQPPQVDCTQAGTHAFSLIEAQGFASLIPAIVIFGSILLAILGFTLAHARGGTGSSLAFLWLFTVLLLIMIVLSSLSIGIFFVPSGLLALAAAILASIPARQPSHLARA